MPGAAANHQAILGEVAEGAARESLGCLTLPKPLIAASRWRRVMSAVDAVDGSSTST